MFELPEFATLAAQFNDTLTGKRIDRGELDPTPHKSVWFNRTPGEFAALTKGKLVGRSHSRGKWLFTELKPGFELVFGECGGRILYHPPHASVPKKTHLALAFDDGSSLTATTQMWGAMELYKRGEERKREYIRDMRPTPIDPEFTFGYFSSLVRELVEGQKRSVKSLLTQDQLIPGLGNAIGQDILFKAKLHPRHPLEELSGAEVRRLYRSIVSTVKEVVRRGGRSDERDLFDRPGGYTRLMDKNAVGKPCPACGAKVQKIQYLGGACVFCPSCQA
jgi:formamidopyrimidine-DNA glycosylase